MNGNFMSEEGVMQGFSLQRNVSSRGNILERAG
jgi:hypothetical protein